MAARRPLRLPLGLDVLAGGALAALVLVLEVRGERRGPDGGFFADPLPALLALVTFVSAVTAGGVAAWGLVRDPLTTARGRWGAGLALVYAVSFPVMWSITLAFDLKADWPETAIPVQALVALGAAGLGAAAPEPERRGLLLIPFIVGATALAFFLGDIVVPAEAMAYSGDPSALTRWMRILNSHV